MFHLLFFIFFICAACLQCWRGPVAGSGPPAVSLRRLLCLAVALVVCRASVAGSFGSCRGLWPTLGLKRLVLGDLSALGRGGADVPDFLRNFFVLIAHNSGPLAVDFGGSSRGLGLYRLLLFGVLLGWRGARGQLWASSGWFSGLLSFAGHLWPAPRV